MNELLLTLQRAGKDYKGQSVLLEVTLSIRKGETVAVVGANGSGKSTLLKLIGGLVGLSRGERVIHGRGGKITIGYMPDRFPKIRMTGWDYLQHMGAISGIPRQQRKARVSALLEQLEMAFDAVSRPCRHYSKGMLQKINMIQAILQPPDLLLLDEPLSGLDARSQAAMMRMLRTLKQDGMAIALTSHEQSIVTELADTIMTIAEGRLMPAHHYKGNGSSAAIIRNATSADKLIAFTLPNDVDPADWMTRQGVQVERTAGDSWLCRVESSRSDALLKAILDSGGHIESVATNDTPKLSQVDDAGAGEGNA